MSTFKEYLPYQSENDIEPEVIDFLLKFNQNGIIPVPIENIVEIQLGMSIIPVPNLRDIIDTEGFISSNLRNITLDESLFEKGREVRLRSTLAHEIGHYVLHKDVYKDFKVDSIRGYKKYIRTLDPRKYDRLEAQANIFSGLLLIPTDELAAQYKMIKEDLESEGFNLNEDPRTFMRYLFTQLRDYFYVGSMMLLYRLQRTNLMDPILTNTILNQSKDT